MFFKKRGGKAQASMEYLLVFGFALFLILPLVGVYMLQQENVQTDISVAQSERVLREMVLSAEEIYFMGEGSQRVKEINFPPRVENLKFEENYVSLNVRGRSASITVSQPTRAIIIGEIEAYEGSHRLVFRNTGGQVEIVRI